jgi:antitoxin ParD1/3/4
MGEIKVPPEFDELIDGLVSSGRYASPGDVVAAAMRLLDEEERARAARLEVLRREVAEGVAEDDRGESLDGDEAVRLLRKHVRGAAE